MDQDNRRDLVERCGEREKAQPANINEAGEEQNTNNRTQLNREKIREF